MFFFSLAATAPYRYILLLSLASPEILPATCAAEHSAERPLSPGFLRLCVSLLLIMFVCSHPPHQKKGNYRVAERKVTKIEKKRLPNLSQKKTESIQVRVQVFAGRVIPPRMCVEGGMFVLSGCAG